MTTQDLENEVNYWKNRYDKLQANYATLCKDHTALEIDRDNYRTQAELKEANADANRIRNNELVAENEALKRALDKAERTATVSSMCLAAAVTSIGDLTERVGK